MENQPYSSRNPAPPKMILFPLFIGCSTMPGGAGFLPSTVCFDGIYQERLLMVQKFGEPVEAGSYPIIYRVSYISTGSGFLPSTGWRVTTSHDVFCLSARTRAFKKRWQFLQPGLTHRGWGLLPYMDPMGGEMMQSDYYLKGITPTFLFFSDGIGTPKNPIRSGGVWISRE